MSRIKDERVVACQTVARAGASCRWRSGDVNTAAAEREAVRAAARRLAMRLALFGCETEQLAHAFEHALRKDAPVAAV
jgi:hypothetical protein